MFKSIIIFIVSVFIASCSQILLKKSANISNNSKIKEYLNKYVIVAYLLLFISTLLTMYAYKKIELSTGVIIESISYIIIAILSYFILHEKINKKEVLGIFLIVVGIIIFSIF